MVRSGLRPRRLTLFDIFPLEIEKESRASARKFEVGADVSR
jgi:hypothetical protein